MIEKKKTDFDKFIDDIQREIIEEERAIYSEKTLEEANNPKNVGRMTDCDAVGILDGSCGDTIEIYMKVRNDRITDISFMTDGCGATIACGSIITEMVKGKSIENAMDITKDDLIEALGGLPPENLHCAALAVGSLKKAILDYRKKRKFGWGIK
jgi:nitrogen fixation NifU-like protein